MASSPLSGISIGGTLGVTFVGVCISFMFYGVTCLQTFTYYLSAALDSAHQAIVIHAAYNYLALDVLNPLKLIALIWYPDTLVNSTITDVYTLDIFQEHPISRWYLLVSIGAILTLANFSTNLVYANALLTSLNSRKHMMHTGDQPTFHAFDTTEASTADGRVDPPAIHIGMDRPFIPSCSQESAAGSTLGA
ncbi:hypothetical protein ACG7TL_001696 [Trametes sanguinea]